ncbi:unnamed protein product [Musa hybrid cultivar]
MANVPAVQLLQAAKFVLSIAAGGFLLVCQRPMDFPNFVAAMYLLVIAAILLLYFSLGRPQLGSTVATTAVGFRSATIPDLVSLSVTDSDQIPSSSLGFQLTDCSTLPSSCSASPPEDFFSFASGPWTSPILLPPCTSW